jgi:hypothetical protein
MSLSAGSRRRYRSNVPQQQQGGYRGNAPQQDTEIMSLAGGVSAASAGNRDAALVTGFLKRKGEEATEEFVMTHAERR